MYRRATATERCRVWAMLGCRRRRHRDYAPPSFGTYLLPRQELPLRSLQLHETELPKTE